MERKKINNIVILTLALALGACSNGRSGGGGGKPARPSGSSLTGGPTGRGTTEPAPAPTTGGTGRVQPVHRAVITDGDQDSPYKKPDVLIEVNHPKAEITVETLKDRAINGPGEENLNRKPILTPPPKRADNEIPWFDQNKPYKSVLKTCGTPQKPCPKPDVVLLPAPPAPPPETPRIVFDQPLVPHTKALDILFVVDTSDSLDVVLPKIVSQIGRFIDNLPPHNDYNIAVMLSHSPDSPWASIPFVLSYGGDVPVLKSKSMSLPAIREKLMAKIAAVKNNRDKTDGQGELGVLAVEQTLNNVQKLKIWKDAGFFRDDAGLTVIFVSDEQDVCFDYSKHPNLKPHYTPNIGQNNKYGRDEFEARAFDKYCKDIVTTEGVLEVLRGAKQDRPIILTGILFLSDEAIKNARLTDKYRLEHEIGHGYIDLIRGANGEAVELGTQNFGEKMAQLGLFSNIRLSFVNKFEIKDSPHMVKCSSIEVRLTYPPASRRPPMVVPSNQVWYEEPFVRVSNKAIIKGFIPGTRVEVTYKWADTQAKRECIPANTASR